MKCAICRQGETGPGIATITLERGDMTLVVRAVPAQVCDNCGEEYVDENVVAGLLDLATLGELSASVAHEIRNPLCGILLSLEVLQT